MRYEYRNNRKYKIIKCPECKYDNEYLVNDQFDYGEVWFVCKNCNHVMKPKGTGGNYGIII